MSKPGAGLQRAVPYPYRAKALWRGCCWAVNMGPWHGRWQNGPYTIRDSRNINYGRFTGGVAGSMMSVQNGGRFANSGAANSGLQWDDNQINAIPQYGIMRWLNTGGMSLACTMRFIAIPVGNVRILTKRFGVTNNYHCGALSFSNTAGNKFEFSYSDGVGGVQSVFSGLVPVVGVTYNIVGRHWGNNALSRAEIWVNGKLEGLNAAPATYPAYKKDPPLIYFQDTGSGDAILNGESSMGGLWQRPLTTAEIQALNVNPYVMWGPPAGPEGLPHAGALGLIGCNCCPGWLCAWNDM
jgi:hypothetical protein